MSHNVDRLCPKRSKKSVNFEFTEKIIQLSLTEILMMMLLAV